MTLKDDIKNKIDEFTGSTIISVTSLSGGCISDAYKIVTADGRKLFLKLNYKSAEDMFVKEAHGLSELGKADSIRIPEVYLFDSTYIVTELIEAGSKSKNFSENFGRKFAGMHKYTQNGFGFYEDNYIGSNHQPNVPDAGEKNDWVSFYFNKRILFQFRLAEKNGYATSELRNSISALEEQIGDILKGSEEKPSVLHGDLWGGNYMVDENGEACLIDPAVYYGHREADLAMTKIFGGFDSKFYSAYNEYFPLPEGYEFRENIYKLYHILNHLNLFGRGYYEQAMSLIKGYI